MKIVLINFVLIILIFSSAFSQKKPFTIETLYKVKNVGQPFVSPSGKKICFKVIEYGLHKGTSNSDIYVMNSDGSGLENLTGSEKKETDPFWSSDDNKIYFLEGSQIYSISVSNKNIEQVTDFGADIMRPVLSPDGELIAFTADIYPECGTDSDCNKNISKSDKDGPIQAYIADSLLFRHWTEYREEKESHIIIYDIKNKTYTGIVHSELASPMYKLGGDVRYDFSPDSKELCFTNNPDSFQTASTNSDLYIVPLKGGKPENITCENKAWDGNPVYSPDGKFIAFKMQKEPRFEADTYRIGIYNRATKEISVVTENFDNMVDELTWSNNSKSIYFTADVAGYSPIYQYNLNSGIINNILPERTAAGIDAGNNQLYYTAKIVGKPAEIFSVNLSNNLEKSLTNFNKELLDEYDFRPAEQIWVEGADGINVQVFIVKPHNFDPEKKYPLILNVHGGPQNQWMDSFRGDWQVYPGSGYIVAFPNPHGSTGFGQEYTNKISGDWGGKVFEDLMKVTDKLEKLPYVDSSRIGAMGWSFGGYMMNWFQAQTDRFKCLVSMMGTFDLESMWGATEELWFVNWDLKGQPWNSDIYEKFSPSNFVEKFSTPTLIITGEKDYRVPYTQSVQYFTTLQTLGIDSRLIIFPNDGHWPSFIKSMPLYYNAHLEWFHKYLGGDPAPYDSEELVKNQEFNSKD